VAASAGNFQRALGGVLPARERTANTLASLPTAASRAFASGTMRFGILRTCASGKTMLAKRIPTILPLLSFDEALETTKIHSVAGVLDPATGLVANRLYRVPHHTISDAGLIGGGAVPGRARCP
jgi:predicted ATPase with chaperone activity